MQKQFAWVFWPTLLIALVGCSQNNFNGSAGSFGQGLQVSPTASVTQATYTITGPNGFASAGTVPVGETPDVSVTVSNLPLGGGYQLFVSGTASDGMTVCDGSATFDVAELNETRTIVVHVTCGIPVGDVSIEATLNVCPVLDGLSANSVSLNLGGSTRLDVSAHDSDNGPGLLAYSWSVNGVKLSQQTSPSLNFSCTSRGDVNVAATVSDGDPTPGCADSSSVKVSCQ